MCTEGPPPLPFEGQIANATNRDVSEQDALSSTRRNYSSEVLPHVTKPTYWPRPTCQTSSKASLLLAKHLCLESSGKQLSSTFFHMTTTQFDFIPWILMWLHKRSQTFNPSVQENKSKQNFMSPDSCDMFLNWSGKLWDWICRAVCSVFNWILMNCMCGMMFCDSELIALFRLFCDTRQTSD